MHRVQASERAHTCAFRLLLLLLLADLQMVDITLRVLFRPSPGALPKIHSNLGPDYDERVMPSLINETLKSIIVGARALRSVVVVHAPVVRGGCGLLLPRMLFSVVQSIPQIRSGRTCRQIET